MAYKPIDQATFELRGNYLPLGEFSLDVRSVAESFDILKAGDHTYSYEGMVVACVAEQSLYLCVSKENITTDDGWKKVGGMSDEESAAIGEGFISDLSQFTATAGTVTLGGSKYVKSADGIWTKSDVSIDIPVASDTTAGVMSAADKVKLGKAVVNDSANTMTENGSLGWSTKTATSTEESPEINVVNASKAGFSVARDGSSNEAKMFVDASGKTVIQAEKIMAVGLPETVSAEAAVLLANGTVAPIMKTDEISGLLDEAWG